MVEGSSLAGISVMYWTEGITRGQVNVLCQFLDETHGRWWAVLLQDFQYCFMVDKSTLLVAQNSADQDDF